MHSARIRQASVDFFIAAALLALFGFAALNNAGPHGERQIVLAMLMGTAGGFLRTGTAQARLVGLAAAAVTVAFGAYALIVEGGYVIGTIIAVFAIVRLWSAGTDIAPPALAAQGTAPLVPFEAPQVAPAPLPGPPPYRAVVPPQSASAEYFAAPTPRPEGQA